ncbi:putative zinc finger protein 66 [Dreissena polymorpha]|uniref:Uncharacterized protein n=1 Tax=Dreissena polymorpha TaxID=45954 RepID=A0A9D4DJQ2_DREPO|nr:putative zinc finger protein 66 [Dreissena polymorpha]KAH3750486.1 hypothetical protein DPMN_185009 [Dreissena polymorpha]
MSARVSVVTLNSDREQGEFSCVCVKIETDEWYNAAADLYSVCAKSEQVLIEERKPNCNKQDAFNVVHEQRGCLQMDQDYTKQDGFTSQCVKSEQTEYEVMRQDVEDQAQLAFQNSVFLTREEIELSNVDQYCARPTVGEETIQKDLYSKLDVHSNSEKDDSDNDFVEIFLERDKQKSESSPATLAEPKRFLCEDSSSGVVQPMSPSARDSEENTVTRTVLSLKAAKMKLNEKGDLVKKVKRMKKVKTPEKDRTEYSHQERNLVSCMNLEPRDNDHFLYCGECNKQFEGDCPVHGPYDYIQDKEVPEGDPLKADQTVPDCLVIKTSKIAGAGLGVFSKEALESRVMFGPYGGDIIAENQKSGYCWQTLKEGKPSHFVYAQNKATSNWMRYVNCAMTESDQNLVAFQYKEGIYYCTLKPISTGEELWVWYGDEFARELGLIRNKNVCSYSSKNSGHLKIHMRKHTGERQYTCEVCGYLCKQSGNLKTHMRIHTGERPYKCEECDFAFKQSGELKTHMRIHTGEKPYKCEVCGYKCKRSDHLKTHMMTHTGERPYTCEECDFACKQCGDLRRHMRIHTGEKEYKCEVCGYECNHSGHLKIHMRKHTGERPYKCEVCGYLCKQNGHLKTHMRIHTRERPHKCEECDFACKQSGDLKRHIRIHTGERPYKCEECGYCCKHSFNLKTHMRKHTGERPYRCKMCDFACKHSGHFKIHMRIHTGERPYTSKVCDYACKESGSLKKHMMIHTGDRP